TAAGLGQLAATRAEGDHRGRIRAPGARRFVQFHTTHHSEQRTARESECKKTASGIMPAMAITLKTADDMAGMRIAGRLASEVLDMLALHVKPGITTEQLDKLAHDHIVNVQGGVPAPLNYAPPGYTPYPKSICTSVNHQVCHGIPNDRALKSGDIV